MLGVQIKFETLESKTKITPNILQFCLLIKMLQAKSGYVVDSFHFMAR